LDTKPAASSDAETRAEYTTSRTITLDVNMASAADGFITSSQVITESLAICDEKFHRLAFGGFLVVGALRESRRNYLNKNNSNYYLCNEQVFHKNNE